MKQQKLFPIKIDQGLIDIFYLYEKDIKKLTKLITKANNSILEYKNIKSEVSDYKLTNGTLSFLFYKKVHLYNSILNLHKAECRIWHRQLDYRKNWITNFYDFIQDVEIESQKRNYLYAL